MFNKTRLRKKAQELKRQHMQGQMINDIEFSDYSEVLMYEKLQREHETSDFIENTLESVIRMVANCVVGALALIGCVSLLASGPRTELMELLNTLVTYFQSLI